jgi:hypothetical protein
MQRAWLPMADGRGSVDRADAAHVEICPVSTR